MGLTKKDRLSCTKKKRKIDYHNITNQFNHQENYNDFSVNFCILSQNKKRKKNNKQDETVRVI